MPCISLPINQIGPTLEIGISLPLSLNPAGAQTPPILWILAIADTGCSHTSIHSSIATKCGLTVLGKGGATTPAGNVAVNLYHGDLLFRSLVGRPSTFEWRFADRTFVEMLNPNPAFDALLGMDILNEGTFICSGLHKQATFSWQ
jgi:hypothetical protein